MALSRYCLDTSAYSQFRRGVPEVMELINRAEWLGLPAATLGELWSGFLQTRRRSRNEAELRDFLTHPVVEEVPIDGEVARIYGEIVVALRRAGTPIPTNDIWVAAAGARVGATILTYDDHFRRIERVGSLVLTEPA